MDLRLCVLIRAYRKLELLCGISEMPAVNPELIPKFQFFRKHLIFAKTNRGAIPKSVWLNTQMFTSICKSWHLCTKLDYHSLETIIHVFILFSIDEHHLRFATLLLPTAHHSIKIEHDVYQCKVLSRRRIRRIRDNIIIATNKWMTGLMSSHVLFITIFICLFMILFLFRICEWNSSNFLSPNIRCGCFSAQFPVQMFGKKKPKYLDSS